MHGCFILQRQNGVPPCNLIAYRHRRGPGQVHWYLQDSKIVGHLDATAWTLRSPIANAHLSK